VVTELEKEVYCRLAVSIHVSDSQKLGLTRADMAEIRLHCGDDPSDKRILEEINELVDVKLHDWAQWLDTWDFDWRPIETDDDTLYAAIRAFPEAPIPELVGQQDIFGGEVDTPYPTYPSNIR
jgi:hypothetical protein